MDMQNTMKFGVGHDRSKEVREVMRCVYNSLTEKGYDPVSQIVGYIMSGDPTYITSHNNARVLITKIDRDELMEELVKSYIAAFEE